MIFRLNFSKLDPRVFQIVSLSTFVFFGLFVFEFDTSIEKGLISIFGCLLTQYLLERFLRKSKSNSKSNIKSAFITGCSLALLLRTSSIEITFLASVLAVLAKFAFTYSNKHLFNPANFAIVILIYFDLAWVSPGQWGNSFAYLGLLLLLGGITVWRSLRYDVALVFLLTFSALVAGRAVLVGDPFVIILHRLTSGSLLLFSFFMITDPRSTPNHPVGRYIFAILVAILGWWGQAKMFRSDALFYALFLVSGLTWLIDFVFKAGAYRWESPRVKA